MRSTCLAIVYFAERIGSLFWYFELRGQYRRQKVHVRYLIARRPLVKL